jgi:hypothetical protein
MKTVVSPVLWSLYLQGNIPWYASHGTLGRPQPAWMLWREKNFLTLLGIKPSIIYCIA